MNYCFDMLLVLKIWFCGAGSFQFLFPSFLWGLCHFSWIVWLFFCFWMSGALWSRTFSVFLSFFGVFVISANNGLANSLP